MQSIPGLVYADSVALFANSRDGLEKLLAIFSSERDKLGLTFRGKSPDI